MFGAFSRAETELMRVWVRSMGETNQKDDKLHGAYEAFIGVYQGLPTTDSKPSSEFGRRLDSILPCNSSDEHAKMVQAWGIESTAASSEELFGRRPVAELSAEAMPKLLPLWFLSTSLLEQFPLSPTKFATPLGMTVLRLLRSQLGFGALHREEDICAGIDDVVPEHEEGDMVGLWELGEKLYLSSHETGRSFNDMKDFITSESKDSLEGFYAELLELRTRPYGNTAILLGLTLGFAQALHGSNAFLDSLEDERDRETLKRIAEEEEEALLDYVRRRRREAGTDIHEQQRWEFGFEQGYQRAIRAVIEVI
jgi:hypothetical protein